MNTAQISPDARETLEKFLAIWPVATRQVNEERINDALSCHMLKNEGAAITKNDLLDVIDKTWPTLETVTTRLRDPAAAQSILTAQQAVNEQAPLVQIQRWNIPAFDMGEPVRDVFALQMSPRKQGSTDVIMDALLDGVKKSNGKAEKKCVADLTMSPCKGCLVCQEREMDNYCILDDDMSSYVYHRFLECDAFVLGFPVYCGRECAQAAIFFDRLKSLNVPGKGPRSKKKRKGAIIATWGWPSENLYNSVAENAAFILRIFGVETAEIITGSGFWGAYYEKGAARLDQEGLQQAELAGKALVC